MCKQSLRVIKQMSLPAMHTYLQRCIVPAMYTCLQSHSCSLQGSFTSCTFKVEPHKSLGGSPSSVFGWETGLIHLFGALLCRCGQETEELGCRMQTVTGYHCCPVKVSIHLWKMDVRSV